MKMNSNKAVCTLTEIIKNLKNTDLYQLYDGTSNVKNTTFKKI